LTGAAALRLTLAAAVLACTGVAASAQGAHQGKPAVPDLRGPDGVFTITPNEADWAKFQTVRQTGLKCTEKACGGDRVFCLVQTRSSAEATAGGTVSQDAANRFGAGVIERTPKEMRAEYLAPFAPRRIGENEGSWAEVKAEGEPGSVRFGLFLVEAKGYEVALSCAAPTERWAAHQPQIEALLASLHIAK
jgi:hypothetical protein